MNHRTIKKNIRRGQYFWHVRAAIGQAAARAVAQRVQVAEHTLAATAFPLHAG
jgi:hypothetical protein